ncbi:histone demethylase SWIRM1 [Datura stramonium]|uniref:Histone demethylase SWIRM1 n=1 Tax=Datura stramonium TaxID=4076 RepID=A0ABS8T2K1_DATST|nr:histone demethylase SWIRM1 [Datura stramonium]
MQVVGVKEEGVPHRDVKKPKGSEEEQGELDIQTDMQSQLMCSGCRTILLYPRGASNVCCAVCNALTPVPPPGMEMAQLICGGCRTLLMHPRGATSVRCSCCHTVNLVPGPNQFAHVYCGNCRMMLMYPCGAPSVKCAVCHYITNVNVNAMVWQGNFKVAEAYRILSNVNNQAGDGRAHAPLNTPNGTATPASGSTSTAKARSQSQTVVVQNPMSVDESGKLVSNVVVGVTTTS